MSTFSRSLLSENETKVFGGQIVLLSAHMMCLFLKKWYKSGITFERPFESNSSKIKTILF